MPTRLPRLLTPLCENEKAACVVAFEYYFFPSSFHSIGCAVAVCYIFLAHSVPAPYRLRQIHGAIGGPKVERDESHRAHGSHSDMISSYRQDEAIGRE